MRELEIGESETAGELSTRLANLAAECLLDAVEQISRDEVQFHPQAEAGVTPAPKVGKELGQIDWGEGVEPILRRIRAVTPWPGADVELRRAGRRFRILEARRWRGASPPPQSGRVRVGDERLGLSAVDGWIEVFRLQVPGRRPVRTPEFLRGTRVPEGEEVVTP